MSPAVLYRVRCHFTDETVGSRWAQWLLDEHFADLLDAGALRCEGVRLDGPGCAYEAQYRFADRAALDHYLAHHAERLRGRGLALFPLTLGLRYEREIGELIAPASGGPPR